MSILHHTLMSQYKHTMISGTGLVTYESVANCVTPEVIIYGKCVQNGTPTPSTPFPIIANNNVYSINGSYYPIPTLYSADNIKDEYYPLTGKVIRRVKSIILDNPDSVVAYTYQQKNGVYFYNVLPRLNSTNAICTHENTFKTASAKTSFMWVGANSTQIYWIGVLDALGMTLDEFKVWLVEQKNTGIPVTVMYADGSETAEYVDPVQITSVRGTNVIAETDLNSKIFGIPFVEGTQIDVKYLTHS